MHSEGNSPRHPSAIPIWLRPTVRALVRDVKGAIKGVTRIRKIDLNEFINKTKTGRRKQLLGQYAALISLWVVFPSACFYVAWDMGGLGALFFSAAGLFMIAVGIMGGRQIIASRQVPPGLESFYTDPRQPQT
jgi:hypothetical protein